MHSFLPLALQRHAFTELFSEQDVLLVLARGLGLDKLSMQLLEVFVDPHFLVLYIYYDEDEAFLQSALKHFHEREPTPCIHILDSSTTGEKRTRLYAQGGVFILTPQIFLIDVLREHIPTSLVTSVVLKYAHRTDELGMEAFGLYLLKRKNPSVLIKALSDRPEAVAFSTERCMSSLHVRELILLPRFHKVVSEELEAGNVRVDEYRISLTARQKLIQVCLTDLLTYARNDLIKSHRGLDDLVEEAFTNEVILSDRFESFLAIRLQATQRVLSLKTKQIIEEVRILRQLAKSITRVGPVAFEQQIQLVLQSAPEESYQFLLTDAAEVIQRTSKERLEEVPPKWHALERILREDFGSERVLILCEHEATKGIIQKIITVGAKQVESTTSLEDYSSSHCVLTFKEFNSWPDGSVSACIFYDISLQVVRSIELHLAESFKQNETQSLKLMHLVYADSFEEQKYLREIREEKNAFERLINKKAILVIPEIIAEPVVEDGIEDHILGGATTSAAPKAPKHVIVDMRELRSPLPFLLHKNGFAIDPQTITVGDYLLSNAMIAIERKSVADLVQSLENGRLADQSCALLNTFQRAGLLIEFERGRPFQLQTSHYQKSGISINDVSSRLVLLLLHFPRLRLLWSSSPLFTCHVFSDLIDCFQEEKTGDQGGTLSHAYNQAAKEALVGLPGVGERNVYLLMNHFASVRAILTASKAALMSCIGDSGALLYDFLHSSR